MIIVVPEQTLTILINCFYSVMVRYEGLEVVDAEWCLCKGGKRLFSGIKRLGRLCYVGLLIHGKRGGNKHFC